MTTTLFGSLFSLPRTMYSMASDGLLFAFLARVSKKTQVPTVNLAISGVTSGIIALIFDLDHLVEFMSIGTFMAYTIVSASVIVLRYRPPPLPSQAMDNTVTSDTTIEADGSSHHLASPATEMPMDSECQSMYSSTESQVRFIKVYILNWILYTDVVFEKSMGKFFKLLQRLIEGFCTDGIGRVKPRYVWLSNFLGSCEPGAAVTTAIIFYAMACISFCSLLVFLSQNSYAVNWYDYLMLLNLIVILVSSKYVLKIRLTRNI